MKKCPHCDTVYGDEVMYCLNDGTALVEDSFSIPSEEEEHDTMQLWNQRRHINVDENGDPLPSRCCSLDDVYDARRVAESLGFPFYVLNLEKEFDKSVVEPFVQSYLEGETPIPCVACNSRLKFASLDKLAQSLGCDKVATGHYARIEHDEKANR